MKLIQSLASIFILLAFLGCSSLQIVRTPGELESTPPAPALMLNEKHSGWNMANPYSIPAGTYLPIKENEDGYFYQAPGKITVSPYKTDGGIFWAKNTSKPIHVYMADGAMFWNIVRDEKLNVEIVEQ